MELGKQIRKLRSQQSISQEMLAQKVYVSRQTISNWENDKSYPDVNSLLLLSEVFDTSLDQLIKGDVEIMKQEINSEDRRQFEKLSQVFTLLFLAMILSPVPLLHFLNIAGFVIWGVLAIITLGVALLVEKKKKQFDIQTYKEIIAFSEGTRLDEIAKAREEGKRPYQKLLLVVGSAAVTLGITILISMLL